MIWLTAKGGTKWSL